MQEKENLKVSFLRDDEEKDIDYIFILGGDGSILWTIKKVHMKNKLKPIFAFNMGTIGFICQFIESDFDTVI